MRTAAGASRRTRGDHARVIARNSEFHRFRPRPTLAGLGRPH